jgi:hypothetical protein
VGVMGVLVALLGMIAQISRPAFIIYLFTVSSVFASTAALLVAGKPILVSVFLLPFLTIYFIRLRDSADLLLWPLANIPALRWFLLFVIWAVSVSVFAPKFYEGKTWVFNVDDGSFERQLLSFGGGHIAQMMYLVGTLVVVWLVAALVRFPPLMRTFACAILATGVVNIFFAFMDLLNFHLGFPDIITPFKNATYAMVDQSMHGLRRVSGLFSETSAFSGFTIGILTFAYFLFRYRMWPLVSGGVAALSALLLLISTSSSAYLGLFAFGLAVLAQELRYLSKGTASRHFLGLTLLALAGAVFLLAMFPEQVAELVDSTIIEKLASESGIERMMWNDQAMVNLSETGWLGVGLGGNRASSLVVVVLSNVGVVGFILYLLLIGSVIKGTNLEQKSEYATIASAAKVSFLVMLVPATMSATTMYMGTLASIFMGLACFSRYFQVINGKP